MHRVLFVIIASAVTFLAQSNSTLTGSVSGRIVDTDTSTPIVGIRVLAVSSARRNAGSPATTDAEGRYHLTNLPPDTVSIEVDPDMGPSPTAPRSITVVGGRDVQADFRTRLYGQVSGRVLDEDGNPIVGVEVTANLKKYDTRTGELQLISERSKSITDDQGRYTIKMIAAGRPIWIVANRPKTYASPVSDSPSDPTARSRTWAATYYPKSDSIDTASSIIVHSQEMRDGVDIHMRKENSYCLEATFRERGIPTGMQFLLVESAVSTATVPSVNLPGSSRSGNDGKIRLCDLYPGRFQLIAARLSAFSQESMAVAGITVSDKDLLGVAVEAIPLSKLSGELVWDRQQVTETNQSVLITTYPRHVGGPNPVRPIPIPTTLSLDVITGLSYAISFSRLDSRFYVKDVTYGGSSVLHQPFIPAGGDAKLHIAIATDSGSLASTVLNTDNQPLVAAAVMIVPVTARSEAEVATTLHAGVTDEHGLYVAQGLPPGKYDVFATSDAPPSRVDSDGVLQVDRLPEEMSQILRERGRGRQVEIGPNGSTSVSLTPIRR